MASLAAALSVGDGGRVRAFDLSALSRFRGVKRRQQARFADDRLTVIEDFGHHATAIRDTLVALRARFADTRIVACFEPRSNTSRLESMRQPTIAALSEADAAYIGAVKSRNSEGVQLMDTQSLAADLRKTGMEAEAFESNDTLFRRLQPLAKGAKGKTLVVFFTNGSFGGVIDRFAEECEG